TAWASRQCCCCSMRWRSASAPAGSMGAPPPVGCLFALSKGKPVETPPPPPAGPSEPFVQTWRAASAPQPEVAEGEAGGGVAAETVDAAAGRGRGRAQVDALERRAVGHEPPHRPEPELAEVHRPGVEVPADEVPVVRLERGRAHGVAREHEVA